MDMRSGPLPAQKVRKKVKVDTTKFMTPYLAHSQKMVDLFSNNKYRQAYDKTKGHPYAITPDTPEMLRIRKAQEHLSDKLYTEAWDEEKTMFFPYNDSPEIRRVAKAQKVLSDVQYKKGHDERKAKYTSLADPPEVELAKKVFQHRSDLKYHEDYNKKVKGKWCETPYFDVAIAKMAMNNLSAVSGFFNRKRDVRNLYDICPRLSAAERTHVPELDHSVKG
ncbi:nebulin-like [Arapaima gigas]